ncbi:MULTISPECIES: GAP family protein [unclassified Plantibacter]|uniref:GAP family protein n=1 Tax=unclassified Plantibacter TaxID=2624265 RepID=UPI003D32FCB0
MGEVVLSLLPLVLGVVLSPLAIMALVAVLLSRNARANGVMFLIGWALAVVVVLGVSFLIFTALAVHDRQAPPLWVAVVRIVLAVVLILGAVFVYRRGKARIEKMAVATTPAQVVAAAPQLPGWLHAVESFSPFRSFLLGFGIFLLNPVDASCAILASLELRLADLPVGQTIAVAVVFAVLGVLPIALPVVFTLVRGEAAQPLLDRTRTWIAGHTNVLNAALLLVIAVLQLQKGISALLA